MANQIDAETKATLMAVLKAIATAIDGHIIGKRRHQIGMLVLEKCLRGVNNAAAAADAARDAANNLYPKPDTADAGAGNA
jgi:hypothetical protein